MTREPYVGRCLCGGVRWTVRGPLEPMWHCHCSRCRKAHGTAFATYTAAPSGGFALSGHELVREGSGHRPFCTRCGSVVPRAAAGDRMLLPAGNFEGDPEVRPVVHRFAQSKAPWYAFTDTLPREAGEAQPSGAQAAGSEALDGFPSGSCLCGAVHFVVERSAIAARNCHCGRCRKARSAAHASNFVTALDGVRFTRGESELTSYKVADARFFTQVFCRGCGSPMPRRDDGRSISILPMGPFDTDPGVRAQAHIFVGSKAPWYEITDALPQYEEQAP